jgi:predicted regulator of Ras-like GTPase activity (Roadblock/LC7/MglB family)
MASINDGTLREERMIFYEEDIEQIGKVLRELLNLSKAKCAIMIDKEGHMVAREGAVKTFDMDSLAALVAGSFAATKAMAKLLGEDEFSVMFHQGQRDNIQLTLVGDRTILTVIFDDQTQLGMIRLYTQESVKELNRVFAQRKTRGSPNVVLSSDFDTAGKANLDSVFK